MTGGRRPGRFKATSISGYISADLVFSLPSALAEIPRIAIQKCFFCGTQNPATYLLQIQVIFETTYAETTSFYRII